MNMYENFAPVVIANHLKIEIPVCIYDEFKEPAKSCMRVSLVSSTIDGEETIIKTADYPGCIGPWFDMIINPIINYQINVKPGDNMDDASVIYDMIESAYTTHNQYSLDTLSYAYIRAKTVMNTSSKNPIMDAVILTGMYSKMMDYLWKWTCKSWTDLNSKYRVCLVASMRSIEKEYVLLSGVNELEEIWVYKISDDKWKFYAQPFYYAFKDEEYLDATAFHDFLNMVETTDKDDGGEVDDPYEYVDDEDAADEINPYLYNIIKKTWKKAIEMNRISWYE